VEDSTTQNYQFGWSVDRQKDALGLQVPLTLQYSSYFHSDPNDPTFKLQFDACNQYDRPDEPVRAFRFKNTSGQPRVQITFPENTQNRRMIGADLYDARKENAPTVPTRDRLVCGKAITFNGSHWVNPGPASPSDFDDNEWISTPYYVPDVNADGSWDPGGGEVYVVMHQEFRVEGDLQASCDPAFFIPANDCWLASLTFAETASLSEFPQACPNGKQTVDGPITPNITGTCYMHNHTLTSPFTYPPYGSPASAAERAKQVIAAIPYQYYAPSTSRRWGRNGYKENSNVIRGESGDLAGKYFTLATVSAPPVDSASQKTGLCLLQTDNLAQPTAWRVWNGTDFSTTLVNGYDLADSASNHVCQPVAPAMQPWSLTYNTYLKKYMLVASAVPGNGLLQYLLSDDLLNWSDPQPLVSAPQRDNAEAACLDGLTYSVIIDPHDPANPPNDPAGSSGEPADPNFDHPNATPDIYASYMNVDPLVPGQTACQVHTRPTDDSPNGDSGNLIRMPIDFRGQRQADLNSGTTDPKTGFDDTALMSTGCSTSGNVAYEGPSGGCAQVSLLPPLQQSGYGKVNTRWKEGSDVWYGAAYYLPDSFFTSGTKTRLMRWSGDGDIFGGIQVNTTSNRAYVVRGQNGSSPTEVEHGANFFSFLFHNTWLWIEVHQLLNTSSPSSEVYVNGKLVSASLGPNKVAAGTINDVAFGLLDTINGGTPVTIGVDQASLLGGERGVLGALKTPTGLRKAASGSGNTLEWNSVPGVTRYRLYRKNPAGAWGFLADVPPSGTNTVSFLDNVLGGCTNTSGPRTYRVTSSIPLRDSNVSAELQVNCP
jgi:hypothetical protein